MRLQLRDVQVLAGQVVGEILVEGAPGDVATVHGLADAPVVLDLGPRGVVSRRARFDPARADGPLLRLAGRWDPEAVASPLGPVVHGLPSRTPPVGTVVLLRGEVAVERPQSWAHLHVCLAPGAVLSFGRDGGLALEGGSFHVRGTPDAPVRFAPAGDHRWRGLAVRRLLGGVHMTHAVVDAAGRFGGASAIHVEDTAHTTLSQVTVEDAQGTRGAALHVEGGEVLLHDVVLRGGLARQGGGLALVRCRCRANGLGVEDCEADEGGALWLDRAHAALEGVRARRTTASRGSLAWVGPGAILEGDVTVSPGARVGSEALFEALGETDLRWTVQDPGLREVDCG